MTDLATKLDFLHTYQAWVAEKNTGTPDVSANAYGEHLKAIAAVDAISEIEFVLEHTAERGSEYAETSPDYSPAAALQSIREIVKRTKEQA